MVTYIIVGITVVVSYICFNNREWFIRLALIPYFTVKRNEWYRLITHGFVHADFTHLFVNMFTFWSFGTYMEHLFRYLGYGNGGYMGLYFGGMIVASIPDLIKHHNNPNYVSIGASGAVSAVLFSSIFFDPWSKILLFAVIPIPGLVFGILYLFYCQYMNKRGGDNINHNAHFYGAVYGFIYPALLNPSLIKVFLSHF
ncbi:rhomboid family intramembrane serine protease [Parabacteroides pacaensis]|uniref:rhomboid family intramembrane serine protease n=1 Tax=Parabacteroides pacaensis TaxID=2086575 RepID=UPI000D0E952B|nr:rhomboid family intramembrane serine protease [Parabacteroides pacaensis]